MSKLLGVLFFFFKYVIYSFSYYFSYSSYGKMTG